MTTQPKYEMSMCELETAIGDLLPATLVAYEYIDGVFNGCKVPGERSAFGATYAVDEDRMNAVLFVVSELRGRAQSLAKIFYGPEEDEAAGPVHTGADLPLGGVGK